MHCRSASLVFLLKLEAMSAFTEYYQKTFSAKPATTICIFDKNDYYQCFGKNAEFLAREVLKSAAFIKGSSEFPYVTINKNQYESVLRDLLLSRHYRVEVYANRSSHGQDWSLVYQATPGNFGDFEDILFGANDERDYEPVMVMALKLCAARDAAATTSDAKMVAVACCDAVRQRICVCEFADQGHFSNLEALLVRMNPKECLVQSGVAASQAEYAVIRNMLDLQHVHVTERKPGEFTGGDIWQDLNRLLKLQSGISAQMLPETSLSGAMECLNALIKYLKLLDDGNYDGKFLLSGIDLTNAMRVSAGAFSALALIPSSSSNSPKTGCNREESLFDLLNYCRTSAGRRLLAQYIRHPLIDVNRIEERLCFTEALVGSAEVREGLYQDWLRRVPDLQRMIHRLVKRKFGLQDCFRLYQLIKRLPELCRILADVQVHQAVVQDMTLKPLQQFMEDFQQFNVLVETTVDLKLVAERGEYRLNRAFDDRLETQFDELDRLDKEFATLLRQTARKLSLDEKKSLKLEANGNKGFYFRITKKDEKCLRQHGAEFKIIDTPRGGVRFDKYILVTHIHALRMVNAQYEAVKADFDEREVEIVKEITAIAVSYLTPLNALCDQLATLDVLVSFAMATVSAPVQYIRPTILPRECGRIVLQAARHPCVEMCAGVSFIHNDILLDRDAQAMTIVTGPNMGGKSTYIRTVGLVVLMAQMGMFVPCEQAEISVVDAIYARVGASDSALKGVSTFMAEMLETSDIVRGATQYSLAIIDELGRGTSTYDGFGLAWAISEYIAVNIRCFCVFATHFHELTAISEQVPSIRNVHMSALTDSKEGPTLLYKVEPGGCDESFGISIAELVKFPPQVVAEAKEKAAELEWLYSPNAIGDGSSRASDRKDAEEYIERSLKELKALQCAGDTHALLATIQRIKLDVVQSSNGYLKNMLRQLT